MKTISAVAVFALGASLAVAAPRGDHWRGDHRGHRAGFSQKMAEKLNLSDAQRQQIRDIEKSLREENRAFFETSRATMMELRAAKEANDTAKLEALRPTIESQRAQMRQLRETRRETIRNVLTADQRAQLDAMKAQRQSRK